ncbi:VOC family protein [Litoribacter ruber]|uniref:VOC family protein n=1 Tax=Litoribacter ruber TaxID=702568 RepID=UPI001BDAE27C|nr:VOC family protein [Litoribacter ruber]MBT0810727.1 VOC family protein [Litoribacter ruber]
MKLYRIIFPVNDIEKATEFYTGVFDQQGERVSQGRHYFDLEGTILALYDPIADGDGVEKPWSFHENQYIYICTDQIELVHQKFLNDLNVKYVDENIEIMPWGERMFYANDPFGNPVCFVDSQTVFTGR